MTRAAFTGWLGGVQGGWGGGSTAPEILEAPKTISGLNQLAPKAPEKKFDRPKEWKKNWPNHFRKAEGGGGTPCGAELLKGALGMTPASSPAAQKGALTFSMHVDEHAQRSTALTCPSAPFPRQPAHKLSHS